MLLSKTRLYTTWQNMKARCNRPSATSYMNYGGRGIKVCSAWNDSFEVFKDWAINNGYQDHLTIERNDPDDHYHPGNCCFVDHSHQLATKRKRTNTKHRLIGIRPIPNNKWRAVIDVRKVQIHIGVYDTEQEASNARNNYIKQHGLPHRLNP